ncbi:MAG TPA: hypothetical protein VGI19_02770 [Candidatus Cybelea sp.]|jgi:hypothetical protein
MSNAADAYAYRLERTRRQRRCSLTVDEALEVIDRAEHAERDPAVGAFYRAVTGTTGGIPAEWLSLHDRLSLIARPETLRAIGAAFVAADMVEDAIEYLAAVWRRIPYRRDVLLRSGVAIPDVLNEVWELFDEQMRSRVVHTVGLKEPAIRYRKPPPEPDLPGDHRRTTRTLKEELGERNGHTITIYTTIIGRPPQVSIVDEKEWSDEFDARMRKMKRDEMRRRKPAALGPALDAEGRKGLIPKQTPIKIIDAAVPCEGGARAPLDKNKVFQGSGASAGVRSGLDAGSAMRATC